MKYFLCTCDVHHYGTHPPWRRSWFAYYTSSSITSLIAFVEQSSSHFVTLTESVFESFEDPANIWVLQKHHFSLFLQNRFPKMIDQEKSPVIRPIFRRRPRLRSKFLLSQLHFRLVSHQHKTFHLSRHQANHSHRQFPRTSKRLLLDQLPQLSSPSSPFHLEMLLQKSQ